MPPPVAWTSILRAAGGTVNSDADSFRALDSLVQ